jgi:MOSC domain-containing protein YiiM
VQLLVRRPAVDERETPPELLLDVAEGVVGDNWRLRGSSSMPDHSADPEAQVTMMNARVADLLSLGNGERWKLAGDQIFVDFDVSVSNLPPGTRVRLGSAVLEISAKPHTGCVKFVARFGAEAMRFVNAPAGRALRMRGVNCRIVEGGSVRLGDPIAKEEPS